MQERTGERRLRRVKSKELVFMEGILQSGDVVGRKGRKSIDRARWETVSKWKFYKSEKRCMMRGL